MQHSPVIPDSPIILHLLTVNTYFRIDKSNPIKIHRRSQLVLIIFLQLFKSNITFKRLRSLLLAIPNL